MTKCGVVSIIGKPNAGKSTLLNKLVECKVSIVTYKPQTTRRQIKAIVVWEDAQVIFLDTPGIFDAKKDFDKALIKSAIKSERSSDATILMIDSVKPDMEFIDSIIKDDHIVVINKIDCEKSAHKELKEKYKNAILISAFLGTNLLELKNEILKRIPNGEFLYEKDAVTNLSEKIWSAEITREKIILNLKKEVPYEIYVETTSFEEKEDIVIRQDIIVSNDRYKPIVLGNGGSMIKKIGILAREELQKIMGKKVHLFLNVRVEEKWQEKIKLLQQIGVL